MSQTILCPICGNEVPSGNGICPVCKADLNTLPPDIYPATPPVTESQEVKEPAILNKSVENSTAEEKKSPSPDSPIPDWMRKRLNQSAADREKSKFDFQSYEDMLFSGGSQTAQPKAVGSTWIPDAAKNIPSILDPALTIDEDDSTQKSEVSEDILVDFSVYRPNKKWEDGDKADSQKPNRISTNNRELFSVPVGDEKVLWEGIDAPLIETSLEDKIAVPDDPALYNCVAPGKADEEGFQKDVVRKNRKPKKQKQVHPMLPEQAIVKEELTAHNEGPAENKELIPESGSLVSDLINRIDNNTKDASDSEITELADIPVIADLYSINAATDIDTDSSEDQNAVLDHYIQQTTNPSEKSEHEKASAIQVSDQRAGTSNELETAAPLHDDTEDEAIPWDILGSPEGDAPINAENSADEESGTNSEPLVEKSQAENPGIIFYTQNEADSPTGTISETHNGSIILENNGNNSAEIIGQMLEQFGYHKEENTQNTENTSSDDGESQPAPQNEDIPEIEETYSEEDCEIPWDLFGSGDMTMPQVPVDPAYRTFSRSSVPTAAGATSYQRKMMSSVLEKIIQAENEIPPREQSTTRHLPIAARLFWALLAIAGVVFILLTNVTDKMIITRPAMTDRSQDFVQKLSEIKGDVLLVIDYTPAYGTLLDTPLHALSHKLLQNDCKLRFCIMNSIAMPNAYKQLNKDTEELKSLEWWPAGAVSIRAHLDAGDVPENIYLITADASSIQTWGEQLYAAGRKHALHVLSPEQLEPVIITWLNAGIVSSALFRENDYEMFTDGPQLYKMGRNEYAVFYLTLLLILSWPCGIIMTSIHKDSLLSEKKARLAVIRSITADTAEKPKEGAALEQQL